MHKYFFIVLLISVLFITDVFALDSQLGAIKKLEEEEKTPSPEAIVRPRLEYKAEGLKNPFQGPIVKDSGRTGVVKTPGSAESKFPSLKVQGIIWGGSLNQAIINNKVVKVGDTIEGTRVISIDEHGITIFFEGKQYKLLAPVAGLPLEISKEDKNAKDF